MCVTCRGFPALVVAGRRCRCSPSAAERPRDFIPASCTGTPVLSHPLLLLILENGAYKENHLGKFQAAATKPISTEGRLITQLINPTDVTLNACFFVILLHTSCWLHRVHGRSSECLRGAAGLDPGAPCPGERVPEPRPGCAPDRLPSDRNAARQLRSL